MRIYCNAEIMFFVRIFVILVCIVIAFYRSRTTDLECTKNEITTPRKIQRYFKFLNIKCLDTLRPRLIRLIYSCTTVSTVFRNVLLYLNIRNSSRKFTLFNLIPYNCTHLNCVRVKFKTLFKTMILLKIEFEFYILYIDDNYVLST